MTAAGFRSVSVNSEPFVSLLARERAREPVEALVEAVAGRRTGRLDVPVAVAHLLKAELVRHLGGRHRLRKVLLVREDEHDSVPELILVQHAVQLLLRVVDTVAIVRVHHEDQALRVLVVMAPQRTDLVLATDVPHREADVLVLNSLDVEPDGRDRRHNLSELQLVQNGGLTSGVEADHKDAALLLAEHPLPETRESQPHCARFTSQSSVLTSP